MAPPAHSLALSADALPTQLPVYTLTQTLVMLGMAKHVLMLDA